MKTLLLTCVLALACLGSANFSVLSAWNKSAVYQKTIAALAERLDGR